MDSIKTLRRAIDASELTQAELAKRAGVTQSAISDFRSGRSGETLAGWLRVAAEVGLELQPVKRRKRATES